MKKKTILKLGISSALAISLFAAPVYGAESSHFSDLKGTSTESVVEKWCEYGVIEGYNGEFRPNDSLTESELDIMLDRLMGRDESKWKKSNPLTYDTAMDFIEKDFINYKDQKDSSKSMSRGDVIVFLDSLVGSTDTVYNHSYIEKLSGGFVETLPANLKKVGWSDEEFRAACELPASSMSAIQLKTITTIRDLQLKPTKDSLVQKVIKSDDVNNYLSGKYKTPKGFVSICNDVNQYVTIEDYYYGLRLDYVGTGFTTKDEYYGVVRFKAENISESTIPKSPTTGGTVTDPYPFGGAGFTTGTNGRYGSPEWTMPSYAEIGSGGAQILTITPDGKEAVVGVYNSYAGRFLCINLQ